MHLLVKAGRLRERLEKRVGSAYFHKFFLFPSEFRRLTKSGLVKREANDASGFPTTVGWSFGIGSPWLQKCKLNFAANVLKQCRRVHLRTPSSSGLRVVGRQEGSAVGRPLLLFTAKKGL